MPMWDVTAGLPESETQATMTPSAQVAVAADCQQSQVRESTYIITSSCVVDTAPGLCKQVLVYPCLSTCTVLLQAGYLRGAEAGASAAYYGANMAEPWTADLLL